MEAKLVIWFLFGLCILFTIPIIIKIIKTKNENIQNIISKKKLIVLYKIEFIGYIILVLSLIWLLIITPVENIGIDSKFYKIEKKLDLMWEYGEFKETQSTIETLNKNEYYQEKEKFSTEWINLQNMNTYIDEQIETSNLIKGILILISTLMIGIGRLGDVYQNLKKIKY